MEPDLLRPFVPLNRLSHAVLSEIAATAEEITFPPGQVIFRQGDVEPWLYFLLEGQVVCQETGRARRTLQSGTQAALHALTRTSPCEFSATATTPARVFRIDENLLESRLSLDQTAAYEVFEYGGHDDPVWVVQMLAQPAFRKIPPANASLMFEKFQAISCKAGETVIHQGDAADHYYLIRSGRAQVTRATPSGQPLMLAELGAGEGFGEEALLTGEPRNATVTLLSEGVLMRLAKQDFDAALKTPLVKRIARDQARSLMRAGAQLVDVRLEDEFRAGTLRNSLNLPLYLLRLKAKALDPHKPYILFCQHEHRSTAAAFLLAQRGLDVYVLKGGLAGFTQDEDVND